MKFLVFVNFLVICGLTLATTSYHHQKDKGQATSYAIVTQHGGIAKQQDWETKLQYNKEHNHYDHHDHTHEYKNYDDNKQANYEYEYGVKDLETGDIKNQWERREGDQVKGGYSLREADGSIRIVEYTADAHNGFNAIVRKIGQAEHSKLENKPQHVVLKGDYDRTTQYVEHNHNDKQPHYYIYKEANDQQYDHIYDLNHDLTYEHTNDHSYDHNNNYAYDHSKDHNYNPDHQYSYKQSHVYNYNLANDDDDSYNNDHKHTI